MPGVRGLSREEHPERRADRHPGGGAEVVAQGHAEASRESRPESSPQLDPVPQHRGRDRRRTGQRDRPPRGGHADEHERRADEQERKPAGLLPTAVEGRWGLEQRLGEVRAPHHRGVRDRTEEDEVDEQPVGRRERTAERHHDEGCREPQRRRVVPERPGPAARQRGPGRLRLRAGHLGLLGVRRCGSGGASRHRGPLRGRSRRWSPARGRRSGRGAAWDRAARRARVTRPR